MAERARRLSDAAGLPSGTRFSTIGTSAAGGGLVPRHTGRVSAPYLYFTDDRLSHAELSAARLDGDVVEIGEGFMPADAVETPALRALSLRPLARPGLALTHGSAAWVHGVRPEPPTRHHLQRLGDRRTIFIVSARVRFRDGRMPPEHTVELGDPARDPLRLHDRHLAERDGRAGTGTGLGRAHALQLFDERPEGVAARALAEPARARGPALGADVLDDGLRHTASLAPGPDGTLTRM